VVNVDNRDPYDFDVVCISLINVYTPFCILLYAMDATRQSTMGTLVMMVVMFSGIMFSARPLQRRLVRLK
jgi:hypothetical protein